MHLASHLFCIVCAQHVFYEQDFGHIIWEIYGPNAGLLSEQDCSLNSLEAGYVNIIIKKLVIFLYNFLFSKNFEGF